MKDRTTVSMAGALASVANGASVKAAAEAHGLTVSAVYKAMARNGLNEDRRCTECGRLKPTAKDQDQAPEPAPTGQRRAGT